jgi:hypothetical protein
MAAPETGLSVVTDAFLMAGVIGQGQGLSNADSNFGFRRLNGLISQWNEKRWMVFRLAELGVTADGRTNPYLIGPTGDIVVAVRPNRIEKAFVRQLTNGALPVDTQLAVWESREQYDLATLKKSFISYPSGVFLDTTYPNGSLYIYPWPTASLYQIFVAMKDILPVITPATLMSTLPGMYLECMKTNLSRLIRQGYGKGLKPDPELNLQAKNALNTVKNANLQVPELQMIPGMPGVGKGIYNIYSDGYS